eukprot:1176952-Prorocentrum_minimum.AAC.2
MQSVVHFRIAASWVSFVLTACHSMCVFAVYTLPSGTMSTPSGMAEAFKRSRGMAKTVVPDNGSSGLAMKGEYTFTDKELYEFLEVMNTPPGKPPARWPIANRNNTSGECASRFALRAFGAFAFSACVNSRTLGFDGPSGIG